MRMVIQRVKQASVTVDEEVIGSVGPGALVLFGVKKGDDEADVDWLAKKLVNLRMFRDEQDKMNLSLLETGGEVLIVSQFTLYADCTKGRRPDFFGAAEPQVAEALYLQFVEKVRGLVGNVATGRFAARMDVALVNDGPVTFVIDSKN